MPKRTKLLKKNSKRRFKTCFGNASQLPCKTFKMVLHGFFYTFIFFPDENIFFPDENIFFPDENIFFPDENISFPDENISFPDENISFPYENISFFTTNELYHSVKTKTILLGHFSFQHENSLFYQPNILLQSLTNFQQFRLSCQNLKWL